MEKKVPLRKCLGCMSSFPKKDLVRVVKTPEGEVILDLSGKKSGRGAYICKNSACLKKAVKSKRIQNEKDAFDQCTRLMSVFIEDTAAWCKINFANSTANPLCAGSKLYVNGVLAEHIVISEGATSIGKYTFKGLTNLKSITVASTVTSIARGAFSTCEALESVTFADADGWKCGENDGATRGFALSSINLANPTTAATFLQDTYSDYYWFK